MRVYPSCLLKCLNILLSDDGVFRLSMMFTLILTLWLGRIEVSIPYFSALGSIAQRTACQQG